MRGDERGGAAEFFAGRVEFAIVVGALQRAERKLRFVQGGRQSGAGDGGWWGCIFQEDMCGGG